MNGMSLPAVLNEVISVTGVYFVPVRPDADVDAGRSGQRRHSEPARAGLALRQYRSRSAARQPRRRLAEAAVDGGGGGAGGAAATGLQRQRPAPDGRRLIPMPTGSSRA